MTPGFAQAAHHLPHVAPQRHVDAGRGLVEEQNARLVRQRLGDQHPALHAARQRHDLGVLLVPQREVLQQLLEVGLVRRLAEQAAAEADRGPHRLEGVGREFLRHQTDLRARRAVVADDVAAVGADVAGRRLDDAADDADERRLAGAVWAEQREDLALFDRQVYGAQGLEARSIGLREAGHGDDG